MLTTTLFVVTNLVHVYRRDISLRQMLNKEVDTGGEEVCRYRQKQSEIFVNKHQFNVICFVLRVHVLIAV